MTAGSVPPLDGQRVLLVAEYMEIGGTRTYFHDLLRFYHRHGAEVHAITDHELDDPETEALAQQLGVRLTKYSTFAESFGLPPEPTVWSRRAFLRERDAFRDHVASNRIDRVTISVGTSGRFLSAASASPTAVMIAHGYPHGIRQRVMAGHVLVPLIPDHLRIVTVSEFSARQFRQAWRIDKTNASVNAVRSTTGPIAMPCPLEAREQLVMTASLVSEVKRPYDWIDIAARTVAREGQKGTEFVWLGDGSMRPSAQERASKVPGASISFPGWCDDPAPYYQRSRVYLQTSSIEAISLSAIDALRHGLPAVVTDAGGLPEVVLDGVNGFVVPVGDREAAAAAVTELLKNDALWNRQALAAQEVYRDRFAPDRWEQAMLSEHGHR